MNNSILFYIVVFIPFSLLLFFDLKGIISDKKALEKSKNNSDVASDEVEVNVDISSKTDNDHNIV